MSLLSVTECQCKGEAYSCNAESYVLYFSRLEPQHRAGQSIGLFPECLIPECLIVKMSNPKMSNPKMSNEVLIRSGLTSKKALTGLKLTGIEYLFSI